MTVDLAKRAVVADEVVADGEWEAVRTWIGPGVAPVGASLPGKIS